MTFFEYPEELESWGYSKAWHRRFEDAAAPGSFPARVVRDHRGYFRVHTAKGELIATTAGRLKHNAQHATDLPAVGDFVAWKERDGLLGATTVTTIFYLAAKAIGPQRARRHVSTLLGLFDIASVTRAALSDALGTSFKDYEDAVLHEAARHAGATAIVTRDPAGFAAASLRVYGPAELLRLINAAR